MKIQAQKDWKCVKQKFESEISESNSDSGVL